VAHFSEEEKCSIHSLLKAKKNYQPITFSNENMLLLDLISIEDVQVSMDNIIYFIIMDASVMKAGILKLFVGLAMHTAR